MLATPAVRYRKEEILKRERENKDCGPSFEVSILTVCPQSCTHSYFRSLAQQIFPQKWKTLGGSLAHLSRIILCFQEINMQQPNSTNCIRTFSQDGQCWNEIMSFPTLLNKPPDQKAVVFLQRHKHRCSAPFSKSIYGAEGHWVLLRGGAKEVQCEITIGSSLLQSLVAAFASKCNLWAPGGCYNWGNITSTP